jgi:hypothetical protein
LVKLQELLPNTILKEEYYHPDLMWGNKMRVQFDIWVEKYNLALEYQGLSSLPILIIILIEVIYMDR